MTWLKRQHYRIVYQCGGDDCGSAAGWQLFLNDKLGGDTDFQHYLVATKESAVGASRYVVLYVNDLAGQPRALVDVVATRAVGRNAVGDRANKASIYFDFGQSSLVEYAGQLEHAKQFVKVHRTQCPIQVIGYTDAVGGNAFNQLLAKERVDAVIYYLRDVERLSPNCLIPEPRGIEAGMADGERAQSRRVDLELAQVGN